MKSLILSILLLTLTLHSNAQTEGSLEFTATTSPTTKPKDGSHNIVAMWVVDSNGKFVKTLIASKSNEYKKDLKNWLAATKIFGSPYNSIDAISSATYTTHAARTGKWNSKNTSSVVVADGNYSVKIEMADNSDNIYKLTSFSFVKGPVVQTQTSASSNGFTNISLKWTPIGTPVEVVDSNEEYKLFPNPSSHVLNVSGSNIESIKLCSLDGRVLYQTKVPTVNISFLPEGVYFLNIQTNKEMITRKFYKR